MAGKRYLWFFVLALVVVSMVSACGGRMETPTPPTAAPSPEVTPSARPEAGGGRTETPTLPTAAPSPEVTPSARPVADGATLLRERCAVCHGLERVESARKTAEEWNQTVDRMIRRGARLTEAERAVLVEYLATHYR